jgi:hypothetical protein
MRKTFAVLSTAAFVTVLSLQVAAQAQSAPAAPPAAQAPAGQTPSAQAPRSQAPAGEAQKSETARGELRSVDSAKKSITLRTATGTDQVFMYDDDTKVTGAQNGVAGLATMSGRQVTVQYTMKGTDRHASSIEVAAAQQQPQQQR